MGLVQRGASGAAGAGAKPFDYDKAIQPDRERPEPQPGAILRVTIDTDHWLSAGQDSETQMMIEGSRVFAPIKLNSGRNVGIYGKKDALIASGLIWPEGQDLLVQKAVRHASAVRTGRRDCVCRRPELPRVHGSEHAALHERRPARSRSLTDGE